MSEKVKEKSIVYIASPYAGDVEKNVEFAKMACRYAVACGAVPFCPQLLYPLFLDDTDTAQRKLGMEMGMQFLQYCSEIWVCGDKMSDGMYEEVERAMELEKWVTFIPGEYVLKYGHGDVLGSGIEPFIPAHTHDICP